MRHSETAFEEFLGRLSGDRQLRNNLAIGLGVAVLAVALKRPQSEAEKSVARARARRNAAEREARRAAALAEAKLKQARRRRMDEWFATDAGKAGFAAETERVCEVLPPFPDAKRLQTSSNYPYNRYGWSSASAHARFEAHYDYISARGSWSLDLAGHKVGGEFSDGSMFSLGCPEGTDFLSDTQRDAILRLLGGPDGPDRVRFVRHFQWHAVREKLWREHREAQG